MLVALFTVAGAALRLLMLGTPALWTDEAFQAVVAAKPIHELLTIVAHDSAPPLSYLLVHFATQLFPTTAGVRLVSALAGCAVVPLGAALGRRLGGPRAAVVGAALLAVLPAEVLISRDARMYAPAAALVLASLLALLRCVDKPTPGRFAVWAVCAAAGLYTHYFVALALAAQVIAVWALLRHDAAFIARTVLAGAAAALLLLPWVLVALPQLVHLSAPFWVPPLTSGRLQELPVQLMNGSVVSPQGLVGMAIHDLRLATVSALFLGLGALFWTRRVSREAAVLMIAAILPLLLLALVSLRKPVFEPRYLEPLWQPLLPVVAVGLARLRWQALIALALLPLVITSVLVTATLPNADVPVVLAGVPAQLTAGDQVVTSGSQYYFPVYYYGGAAVRSRLRIAGWPVRWYDGSAALPPGAYIGAIAPSSGTLYLFGNQHYWAKVPAGYRLRSTRCDGDICLRVFDS